MASQDPLAVRRGRRAGDRPELNRVVFLQRARLLEAVAHRLGGSVAAGVSVRQLAYTSGLSNRTVYELHPAGQEAIVVAAYRDVADFVSPRVVRAFDRHEDWVVAAAAALRRYLELVASAESWARMWFLEIGAAPTEARLLRERALQPMVDRIARQTGSETQGRMVVGVVDAAVRQHVAAEGAATAVDAWEPIVTTTLGPVCPEPALRAALEAVAGLERKGATLTAPERLARADALLDAAARREVVAELATMVARAATHRDGLILWHLLTRLNGVSRGDPRAPLRHEIARALPHALHFGVPVHSAMRLDHAGP